MALGLPKLCISHKHCWHWLLRVHKDPSRGGPVPHAHPPKCRISRCPAHGFWERPGSRRVWMVLPTPLPARGGVRYGEWGAKRFKNPTPNMEPLQCHSHATPLYFVNWLIRNGLPTWNMDRNTLILCVALEPTFFVCAGQSRLLGLTLIFKM